MSAAVAGPSAGALKNTCKRGGDGGDKPPREPTAKSGLTGHNSVKQITEIRNIINKLNLAFIAQIYQSATTLADADEQIRLDVEGTAFLDRNNCQRLSLTHQITFEKTNGETKLNTPYALTATLAHASSCRTIYSGNRACTRCRNGSGNFSECVVATGFPRTCTNCAYPNRYKGCSRGMAQVWDLINSETNQQALLQAILDVW